MSAGLFREVYHSITQEEVKFFNAGLVDTSDITVINFGQNLINYKVDKTVERSFKSKNLAEYEYVTPVFYGIYGQSRLHYEHEWSLHSLDIVLGLVGGLASIGFGSEYRVAICKERLSRQRCLRFA